VLPSGSNQAPAFRSAVDAEETTMATTTETTRKKSRCRRCGADAFAASAPYAYRVRADDGPEAVLHLCGPCGRDFANDRERDEYVRLGLLA
jgi:hypothetical protein